MLLTANHGTCNEMGAAAVTKETDLDQSIYASIDDLHKPSVDCCTLGEGVPRRARALSNQYLETAASLALCHDKASGYREAIPSLATVGEELTSNAPLPPPRLIPLPPSTTSSEQLQQLRHSLSFPGLFSETAPGSQPRSSTPLSLVYVDLITQVNQNGPNTSKSLPTGLCTVTAGPSLNPNSVEDVYIEMIGESTA